MKIIDLERLLPEDLPEGERMLWCGRPDPISLARRAFRADLVAVWFGLMTIWNGVAGAYDSGWHDAALQASRTLAIGFAALALLFAFGHIAARTTLYVITSRRVVLKVGMALPIFFNIPFGEIAEAAVHIYPDRSGNVALVLRPERRIAYPHLWPHVRPFRFSAPQPMLRSVAQGGDVAEILRKALVARAAGAGASTMSSLTWMKDMPGVHASAPASKPITV